MDFREELLFVPGLACGPRVQIEGLGDVSIVNNLAFRCTELLRYSGTVKRGTTPPDNYVRIGRVGIDEPVVNNRIINPVRLPGQVWIIEQPIPRYVYNGLMQR